MHAMRSKGQPIQRDELVAYLDTSLQVEKIEDITNNDLQVEGKKTCN
jgi:hypothetical protein